MITLLSSQMLNENDPILRDIQKLTKGLFKEIGWHYYVDILWVIKMLQSQNIQPGSTIVDAGAGNGLLQFVLSLYGYNVISVDFSPRKFNILERMFFNFGTINTGAKFSHTYISHISEISSVKNKTKRLLHMVCKGRLNPISVGKFVFRRYSSKSKPGKIILYQADIRKMSEISSASIDAVVSISAIEHMQVNSINGAIQEFMRILKVDKPMIVTTSASKSSDWYHQPSEGWCFSLKTISLMFNLENCDGTEFRQFDNIMADYKENSFLRKKLASVYFISDKNGMPRGVWNPQYIPVGIVKNR